MNEPLARVYIAGFEVFRHDAADWFSNVKRVAGELGLEALIPFDESIDKNDTRAIYEHNRALLAQADAAVANISPFRGSEPDSGTVWELGWLNARGKPTFGYTFDRRSEGARQVDYFRERNWNVRADAELLPDAMFRNTHPTVVNLMISLSLEKIVLGTVVDALILVRDHFKTLKGNENSQQP